MYLSQVIDDDSMLGAMLQFDAVCLVSDVVKQIVCDTFTAFIPTLDANYQKM